MPTATRTEQKNSGRRGDIGCEIALEESYRASCRIRQRLPYSVRASRPPRAHAAIVRLLLGVAVLQA